MKTLLLGPPGAGKTHELMSIVESEIGRGVDPTEILFTTFSKRGAREAASRAAVGMGYEDSQLTYWSTIHSICYKEVGVKRSQVMCNQDWQEIGKELGLSFDHSVDWYGTRSLGSTLMGLYEYARASLMSFEEVWQRYALDVDWWIFENFIREVEEYKGFVDKYDFTDMLEVYLEEGHPLPVRVAVVDEAQDLTTLQWRVVEKMYQEAERVYIGGEDLQALYTWMGADMDHFLRMNFDEQIHLDKSQRLPKSVYDVAQEITGRIEEGFDKEWTHNGESGFVDTLASVEDLDVTEGTWYLLARSSHLLDEFETLCKEKGVPYRRGNTNSVRAKDVEAIRAWESLRKGNSIYGNRLRTLAEFYPVDVAEIVDEMKYTPGEVLGGVPEQIWHDALEEMDLDRREYYIEILRRGEKLDEEPRVYIGSIHSVKGGEAENVAVKLDLTKRTQANMEDYPDSEHRVFYVACTRAMNNLYLILPQGPMGYDL